MKTKLLISIFALMSVIAINNAKAQTYDPLAVQRINDLIANNGLDATPDAPETWTFAEWNDETPKQILELQLSRKNLTGSASFAGLTALKLLACDNNNLTELDLTNCTQLKTLACYTNNLTNLNLIDCTQLQKLYCNDNRLAELHVTGCKQLEWLSCPANLLTELDLTGLDNLKPYEFDGSRQNVSFTLYKNEAGEYSYAILLNNPTFENSAVSYSEGLLKSNDNTVFNTSFTVQTTKERFELSGEMNFTYSDETGINDPKSEQLTVYPNPTTGKLEITNYELQIMGIEIYDVSGKMQKAEGRMEHGEGKTIIDISHLPSGIYLVKIVTEQGEMVKKIVKQ